MTGELELHGEGIESIEAHSTLSGRSERARPAPELRGASELHRPAHTATTITERNDAHGKLNETLISMGHELRKIVMARPVEEGETVIRKAGFQPRKKRVIKRGLFDLSDGPTLGSVRARIISPAPGKRILTRWQASADNGVTDEDALLEKPFTPSTLLEGVRRALEGSA